jgi:hypothetical protein
MDPLESVARFRQQEAASNGRALKVAPPPLIPIPATTTGAPSTVDDHPNPTEELDLTALHDRDPASDEAAGVEEPNRLRGNTRGRKQLLYVYLPGPTVTRLDDARPGHGTLGAAVMAALRGSYEWLIEHHLPQPVEAVGPFPAVRGPKRRQGIEEGRLKPFYVDPEEAKGIDTLAEQLEMSMSELVTLAIDHWFGEGRSS